MVKLASLVRAILVFTVMFVVAGSSRTTIDPLSSVTLPAHTVNPTAVPVITSEELLMYKAPPRAIASGEADESRTSGLLVPTSVIAKVLVAPAGASRVKLFRMRLVEAVGESIVTVLVPAFVIRMRPAAISGALPIDQLVPLLHKPLPELVQLIRAFARGPKLKKTAATHADTNARRENVTVMALATLTFLLQFRSLKISLAVP